MDASMQLLGHSRERLITAVCNSIAPPPKKTPRDE